MERTTITLEETENRKGRAYIGPKEEIHAEMTYTMAGPKTMIIDHTGVEENYQGQGYARKLLNVLVAKARKEEMKIIPLCPYAKSEFNKDSGIRDVLK